MREGEMSLPYPLPPTAHSRADPEVIRAAELALPLTYSALREAVSAPYLDNTVELLLDVDVVGKLVLKV